MLTYNSEDLSAIIGIGKEENKQIKKKEWRKMNEKMA